jgi:hypothetical protein
MKTKENQQATEEQIFNAMVKFQRNYNAKKFIETLNISLSEKQTEELLKILCKYEQFLEENN